MQVARVRQMRRASRCVVLHGERVWAHQVVSVSNSSVSCRQGADSGQGPPCAQVSLNSTVPAPGAEYKVAGARADRGELASCSLPHLSMGADTGFALSPIISQHQIQAPFRCGPAFTSPCTSSCAALFQPQDASVLGPSNTVTSLWPECCGGHPERGLGAVAVVPPLFESEEEGTPDLKICS